MDNNPFFEKFFPADFWSSLDCSSFAGDPQSMFGDQEVFEWIIRAVRPRDIIEIGSWKGHSANFMMDVCKAEGLESRLVCVDTFLGGPEHWLLPQAFEGLRRKNGRPTILEAFYGNTIARGNAGRIFPLCLDSRSASIVLRQLEFKSDLIFIDGGHAPDVVTHDITGYYPLLSDRGVMFGDDYQYEPLANAVHECAEKLGVGVLVSSRKWIYLNAPLARSLTLPNVQLRTSYAGWVHP